MKEIWAKMKETRTKQERAWRNRGTETGTQRANKGSLGNTERSKRKLTWRLV